MDMFKNITHFAIMMLPYAASDIIQEVPEFNITSSDNINSGDMLNVHFQELSNKKPKEELGRKQQSKICMLYDYLFPKWRKLFLKRRDRGENLFKKKRKKWIWI